MRFLPALLVIALSVNAQQGLGQQVRLDSLLGVLKHQPEANAARMNALTALAKTYATIKPAEGVKAAHEAWRIADRLNDDRGRANAWMSELWNMYYTGRYTEADSLDQLAESAALRSADPVAIARARVWTPTTWNVMETGQRERAKARMGSAIQLLRKAGATADLAEALFWWGTNTSYNTTADSLMSALALYEKLGDKSGIGQCITSRYNYEPYTSDAGGSLADLLRAAELFEQDGNAYWSTGTYGNLGWYFQEKGEYQRALFYDLKALPRAEAFGDPYMLGAVHDNTGDLYRAMNDLPGAMEQYRLGLLNSPMIVRLPNLIGIGAVFILLHQPDSALAYLQRSIAENPSTGDELRLGEARGYMAKAFAMKGDTLKAIDAYALALAVHDKYPNNYAQSINYSLGLGALYLHPSPSLLARLGLGPGQGREKALHLYEHALALSEQYQLLHEQQDALLALSQWYEQAGDPGRALDFHQRYASMKDSVLTGDKAKAISNLRIQYETEKKEQQITLLGKDKEVQAKEIQKQKLVRNGFIGGSVFLALFAGVFLFQRNRISKEKQRSEDLLLNILPEEVADELKAKGHADAKHFDRATILFTDFKGFTGVSEKLSPAELVEELNTCFKAFDHIITARGIEKIKTIGDAYMCAGGLPDPASSTPGDVVQAAMEMQAFMIARKTERDHQGLPAFDMRVGIHTGPVVAGIVGVKKFAYDIWGDTVNIASRMESSGEVGQVNISESTYALVKNESGLTFTPRGKVQAKGKGEMEMYFVRHS